MTDIGYCTFEDVRRVAQKRDFSGALGQDREIALQAIRGQTDWLQKMTDMHWYEPSGISEDTDDIIATSPTGRDDEHDISTGGGIVIDGDSPKPRRAHGTYTRVRLSKRYVETPLTLLEVRDPTTDSGYTDWVSDSGITAGKGKDYRVQVNSGGFTELYIDTETLSPDADDVSIDSYANAIYIEYEYGEEGLPDTVRRGVAMRAFAELIDPDTATAIPDDGQLINAETEAQKLSRQAEELLAPWMV
jgi:hypothetical protein